MARQVGVLPEKYQTYDWQGRTIKHHRTQIRNFLGFREATKNDGRELTQWLTEQVLAYDLNIEHLNTAAVVRMRQLKIEPPTPERLERITRSAIRTFEERFFANTLLRISPATREQIDKLLNTASPQELIDTSGDDTALPLEVSSFSELKTDPGRIGVDSFQKEVAKLEQIRQLELPNDLFKLFSTKILQIYKQRVIVETPRDLRRHPDPIRYTLIAAFCLLRSQEITDNLVELLISIVHRIGARAEQRVEKELLNDFKKVGGKINLLFQLAEATLSQPDGLVKHVVFPVVSEQKLKDLVKEFKSTGSAYWQKIYTVMRASYGSHYRQILPLLLSLLEFHSNNEVHRPVIQALELMKRYANSKQRYYEPEEIPIEGVLRSGWQDLVLEKNAEGQIKINRINYELSVLQALRDRLRCKQIWVV